MQSFFAEMQQEVKKAYPDNLIIESLMDWAEQYEDDAAENLVAWSLESCNCADCHAPNGLITYHETAEKAKEWYSEIDDALADHKENTGESFAPDSVNSLVWFAVEEYAYELAGFLRGCSSWDEWEAQANDPTETDFNANFRKHVAPLVICVYGEKDKTAMRTAYADHVDSCNRDGTISNYFAFHVTLDG